MFIKHLIEDELLLLRQDLKILICSVKNAKASQKRIYRTFYVSKKHETAKNRIILKYYD